MYKNLLITFLIISSSIFIIGAKVIDKKEVEAVVIKVYDGDTFYVNINNWPDIVGKNMPVRIYGIDCPEIKSENEIEKEYAQKAKLFVINRLSDNENKVTLYNLRRDKYFRILCDVKIKNSHLGDELITAKLARKYDGGHKEEWKYDK